jgi:hypothetical protein
MAQENQVGLTLNGTRPLLAHAKDASLMGKDIGTVNKEHRNFNGC